MTRLAILGAGKLGEALLSGLLRAGQSANDIAVTTRRTARTRELVERYGVQAVTAADAVQHCDVLFVTVKPQDIDALIDGLLPNYRSDVLLVSFAAGIPINYYTKRLPNNSPVIRVMTNTPVVVDEAMSALSAGEHATDQHVALVDELLSPLGRVIRVPESQQDAVTALSGSGPAYFYFLVEAMIDAGILLGLPRSVAHELVVQSAVGSAIMLRDSGEHPVALREAVTSPAGTTINAIRELEKHKVRAAMLAAIEAARDRGRQLGQLHE